MSKEKSDNLLKGTLLSLIFATGAANAKEIDVYNPYYATGPKTVQIDCGSDFKKVRTGSGRTSIQMSCAGARKLDGQGAATFKCDEENAQLDTFYHYKISHAGQCSTQYDFLDAAVNRDRQGMREAASKQQSSCIPNEVRKMCKAALGL